MASSLYQSKYAPQGASYHRGQENQGRQITKGQTFALLQERAQKEAVQVKLFKLRNPSVEYSLDESKVSELWPGWRKASKQTIESSGRELVLPTITSQALHQLFHFLDSQSYLDEPKSVNSDAEADLGLTAACFMHLDLYILAKSWKFVSLREAALQSFTRIFTKVVAKPDGKHAVIRILQQAARTLKISDPVHICILELSPLHKSCVDDASEYDNVLRECYGKIPQIAKLLVTALDEDLGSGSDHTDKHSNIPAQEDYKDELELTYKKLEKAMAKLKLAEEVAQNAKNAVETDANNKHITKLQAHLKQTIQSYDALNAEVEVKEKHVTAPQAQLKHITQISDAQKVESELKEKHIADLQAQLKQSTQVGDVSKADTEMKEEHIAELSAQLKQTTQSYDNLKAETEAKEKHIAEVQAQLKHFTEISDTHKAETELKQKHITELQTELKLSVEHTKSLEVDFETKNNQLQTQLEDAAEKASSFEAENATLKEAFSKTKSLSDNNDALRAENLILQIDSETLKIQAEQAIYEVEILKTENAQSDVGQLKEAIAKKEIEHQLMKDSLDQYISRAADVAICKTKLEKCEQNLQESQSAAKTSAARVKELESCEDQLKQVEAALNATQDVLTMRSEQLAQAEGYKIRLDRTVHGLEIAQKDIAQKDAELETLRDCRRKLNHSEAAIAKLEINITELRAQISEFVDCKQQLRSAKADLQTAETTIAEQEEQITDLAGCKEHLRKTISELETTKVSFVDLTETVNGLKEETRHQASEINTRQSELIDALHEQGIKGKQIDLLRTEKSFFQRKYNEAHTSLKQLRAEHDDIQQAVESIATDIGSALEQYHLTESKIRGSTTGTVRRAAIEIGKVFSETHSRLLALKPFSSFDETLPIHDRSSIADEGISISDMVTDESDETSSPAPEVSQSASIQTLILTSDASTETMQMAPEYNEDLQQEIETMKVDHATAVAGLQDRIDELVEQSVQLKQAGETSNTALANIQQQLRETEAILQQTTNMKDFAESDRKKVQDDLRREQQARTVASRNLNDAQRALRENKTTLENLKYDYKELKNSFETEQERASDLDELVDEMNRVINLAVSSSKELWHCRRCRVPISTTLSHSNHRPLSINCRGCGEQHWAGQDGV